VFNERDLTFSESAAATGGPSNGAGGALQVTYRTVDRDRLVKAVAPSDLTSALDALVNSQVIAGYAEQVVIWGDLAKVEAALDMARGAEGGAQVERAALQHTDHRDARVIPAVDSGRAAYFDAALAFVHALGFKELSSVDRKIWRRHAAGESYAVIAKKLRGVTVEKARWAVGRGRALAGLPARTSAMPRGGGRPPRAPPEDQSRPRCKVCRCIIAPQGGAKWGGKTGRSGSSGARGMCHRHYQQWRARHKVG